jgi:outer membrane protein assembly factor BamB
MDSCHESTDKKGELFIFDRRVLRLVESIKTQGEIQMCPLIDGDDTVYWASHGGTLYCKNIRTGELNSIQLARKPTGMRSSPVLAPNNLLLLATLGEPLDDCFE